MAVRQFVKFAAQLPLPLNAEEDKAPLRSAQSQREIALSQQWLLDKLIDEKTHADDLVGKLGRKVMDHYLYFQGRIKGEENLEHVYRLADEARKLIESNLELFFRLSSGANGSLDGSITRFLIEAKSGKAGISQD